MKVVFYSEKCEYCKKLLDYLDKNNIKSIFKLVNIDNNEAPTEIDIVPTIIDTELTQPMKGKKAFEYLINIKYFNNPTNNIEYIKNIPPNPNIPEDEKAVKSKTINLEINNDKSKQNNEIDELFTHNESTAFYEATKNKEISKASQEMVNSRQIQDKKLTLLMAMKRR